MATNLPSDGCSPFAETVGPFVRYDELERTLGPAHPSMCTVEDTLYYYDGPQCWIGHVSGDPRPRLNVMINEGQRGEGVDTVFTSRHHQFVFADEQVLRSTLHEGIAPTRRSYELAQELIVWETESGHVDGTAHRNLCRTWYASLEEVEGDIVGSLEPEGLPLTALEEDVA